MIVFDLQCEAGHRFEGWFGSAEDFGGQKSRGLLSCPRCGNDEITRLPSATRFNTGSSDAVRGEQPEPVVAQTPPTNHPVALGQALYAKVLDEILKRSEDVGRAFPAEARRIHYEEAPARSIRGIASREEHDELVEEGIPVARLPIPDRSGWN
jgi:hypothetical protein